MIDSLKDEKTDVSRTKQNIDLYDAIDHLSPKENKIIKTIKFKLCKIFILKKKKKLK